MCSNFIPYPPHTATYVATSDFQTKLLSRLLLTGTHLRKRAVAITLSYSPQSTLHPQVIYAIAFSAGLNGFKWIKMIEKTINELLLTLLPACTAHVQ